MNKRLSAMVISMVLMIGCRRTEVPSTGSASADNGNTTNQVEDFAENKTTLSPVELPTAEQYGNKESFFHDPAIVRFEKEIAAFDSEIKALESQLSKQDELINAVSSILTKDSEIPQEVQKLANDRLETNNRIKALEELRRSSIKAEEQRRRDSVED